MKCFICVWMSVHKDTKGGRCNHFQIFFQPCSWLLRVHFIAVVGKTIRAICYWFVILFSNVNVINCAVRFILCTGEMVSAPIKLCTPLLWLSFNRPFFFFFALKSSKYIRINHSLTKYTDLYRIFLPVLHEIVIFSPSYSINICCHLLKGIWSRWVLTGIFLAKRELFGEMELKFKSSVWLADSGNSAIMRVMCICMFHINWAANVSMFCYSCITQKICNHK